MIATIKVSKLSRKILLSEFGQTIKIARHNIEYSVIKNSDKAFRIQSHISESLNIEFPNKPGINAGYHLHRFHFNMLLNFIYSQYLTGNEVSSAIRKFYAVHNIDEDDFSQDSVYRRWQRFITSKKMQNTCKNNGDSVLQNCNFFTLDDLEILLGKYISENFRNFIGVRGRLKLNLVKQARYFIYYEYGEMKVEQIAKLFNDPIRTIYWNIQKFKSKIATKLPSPRNTVLQ